MTQVRPPSVRAGSRRLGVILGAAGVFGASSAVAARGVPESEVAAFRALNELPAWVTPVLWPPMQLGSLWGPVAVGVLTWRRSHAWRPTAGVVIGGVAAWQLAKVVKSFVQRGRPADELDHISWRPGTPREGLGFVSGHTTVAFAMVTALWPYAGRAQRLGLLAVAAVVAGSRIQVGAHLPVDAVGGAALGVLVGETWTLLAGTGPADATTGSGPTQAPPAGGSEQ